MSVPREILGIILTQTLLKMKVIFQIVSYIVTGVSLMFGSIPKAAYKSKYYISLYTGAGSATDWLVQVSLLCIITQSISTDFYCDWFPRAKNIREYVTTWG